MGKIIIGICMALFLFACKEQTDIDNIEFSLLNGNSFLLTVDRISTLPDVQTPGDRLQEANYVPTHEDIQYAIAFSENGQVISIESGSVVGEKIASSKEFVEYELVLGTHAGGRLVIWKNNQDFEVEYTLYGSGVPISRSERGNLKKR